MSRVVTSSWGWTQIHGALWLNALLHGEPGHVWGLWSQEHLKGATSTEGHMSEQRLEHSKY